MKNEARGSLFGSILLIAGCCIGAGMLGVPLVTAQAGFIPSSLLFFASWLFMALTGLLLLEVNLAYQEGCNLITLAEKTLGKGGKIIAWILFSFLFYSLMVAYIAASGAIFSQVSFLPHGLSSILLVLFFVVFLYAGTKAVDGLNRVLMLVLAASYLILLWLGLPEISPERLLAGDFAAAAFVAPVMVISFGYHNLIPSLASYLGGDRSRLRKAVLIGSFLPLIVYLLWEAVILGLLPMNSHTQEAIHAGAMATELVREAVGSGRVVALIAIFSFFAIVTSFLSVAFSFIDFLSDGLKSGRKGMLCFLSVGPPLLFALLYPKIFTTALSLAGAYGAVILYGIMPALMAWTVRYRQKRGGAPLVPGGRAVLLLVIAFALYVVLFESLKHWGALQ